MQLRIYLNIKRAENIYLSHTIKEIRKFFFQENKSLKLLQKL